MPSKSKKDQRTVVTLLLDRSGSMSSVHAQTVEAYNEYVDTLRDSKTPIEFTFLQFDSPGVEKVCVCEPIKNVKKLTMESYQPRGGTPLIDSAFSTIKAIEAQDKAKDAKIVVCIQTDGQENESRKHSWEELKSLIAEKTKAGWQFNFMGAGIDAYQQGAQMGFSAAQTMSYGKDRRSTIAAFQASASNTRSFAAGLSANTDFSSGQKRMSGDRFDPNLNVQHVKITTVGHAVDLNETKADSDFSL